MRREKGKHPTLVIFDVGGVVDMHAPVIPKIAHRLEISEQDFLRLAGSERLHSLLTGQITADTFWKGFSQTSGKRVEEDLWAVYFDPKLNEGVVQLIKNLKREARVVAGTNTLDSHYTIHQQRENYAVFDAVYASNRIGLAKPDPEFYRHILQAEAYPPTAVVFIDDIEQNVLAAEKLGIKGVLFDEFNRVKRILEQFVELA